MKKLATVMVCGMLLFSNTVTSKAETVEKTVQDLSNLLGVDASNLVAHLQTIKITESQQKQFNTYVANAQNLVSGKTELKDLSTDEKTELAKIAKNAGAVVGLTVEVSNLGDQALTTTATITTTNGSQLLSLDKQDVANNVTDLGSYLEQVRDEVNDLVESDIITVVPDNNTNNNNTNNNNTNNNNTNNNTNNNNTNNNNTNNNTNNNNTNNSTNNNTFKPHAGTLKPTGLTASTFGLSGVLLAGAGVALSRKSSK